MFSAMKAAVVLFSLCCQESRGSLWLDIFGWRHIQTRWLEMSSPDSVLPAPVNRTRETEQMKKRTGWRVGALNLYPSASQTCSSIHPSACPQPDSVPHSHFIISSKDLLICLHSSPATECKNCREFSTHRRSRAIPDTPASFHPSWILASPFPFKPWI